MRKAPAALLSAALILSSCATPPEPQTFDCPGVGLIAGQEIAHAEGAVSGRIEARLTGYEGGCRYGGDKVTVYFTLTGTVTAEALDRTQPVPGYFIAVVDQQGNIAGKWRVNLAATMPRRTKTARPVDSDGGDGAAPRLSIPIRQKHKQTIHLAEGARPSDYEILIGFTD